MRQGAAIRVIAKPSFQQHWAIVRDFSDRGVGLFLPCRFEPGTRMALLLRAADDGWLSSIIMAEVRHTVPDGDDSWLIGCVFDKLLSDQEFCLLFE